MKKQQYLNRDSLLIIHSFTRHHILSTQSIFFPFSNKHTIMSMWLNNHLTSTLHSTASATTTTAATTTTPAAASSTTAGHLAATTASTAAETSSSPSSTSAATVSAAAAETTATAATETAATSSSASHWCPHFRVCVGERVLGFMGWSGNIERRIGGFYKVRV
ncbi:hypothetical protein Hanom_Chr06g00574041 [Helianthus anomalus]